jgi:Uma2 family endonuclease
VAPTNLPTCTRLEHGPTHALHAVVPTASIAGIAVELEHDAAPRPSALRWSSTLHTHRARDVATQRQVDSEPIRQANKSFAWIRHRQDEFQDAMQFLPDERPDALDKDYGTAAAPVRGRLVREAMTLAVTGFWYMISMMDMQHGMLPSMATTPARGAATAADIGDDDRTEVIRGELVPKEAASFEHSSTQGRVMIALGTFDGRPRGSRLGGWWLGTEAEIELEPHEVFLADVAGWRIERVLDRPSGRPVRIRPDWVCEILSPSTMRRDRGHKQQTYHRAGIGHYWLVEPLDGLLWVYRWSPEGYTQVAAIGAEDVPAGELVRVEPFDAIGIDLADLFNR